MSGVSVAASSARRGAWQVCVSQFSGFLANANRSARPGLRAAAVGLAGFVVAVSAPALSAPTVPGLPEDPLRWAAPRLEAGPGWSERVSVDGFATLWLTPERDLDVPFQLTENALQPRFVRLGVRGQLGQGTSVRVLLGLDVQNPVLDASITHRLAPGVVLTGGQFRIPFGASVLTAAFATWAWDRPRYVYAMTKGALRDVGLMVHSGRAGVADGLVEYWLGAFNGNGRLPEEAAEKRRLDEYLYVGRLVLNLARLWLPRGQRLALGVSAAHSHDPGVESAPNRFLGGALTPFGLERGSRLLGADLTVAVSDLWLQAELMRLISRPEASENAPAAATLRALGFSLEVGHAFSGGCWLPVARYERLDPGSRIQVGSAQVVDTLGGGANFFAGAGLRLSAFGLASRYVGSDGGRHLAPAVRLTATARF